jgi:hypothetical protein
MIARRLAARLGATIIERRGGMTVGRYVISEFHTRTNTIVVYADTLEILAELVCAHALPFEPEQLLEIAIAHECFHLSDRHGSEAAAHAFVRDLLGLPESPAILSDLLPDYVKRRGVA